MNKALFILGIVILVAASAAGTYFYLQQTDKTATNQEPVAVDDSATEQENVNTVSEEPGDSAAYVSEKGVNISVTTPEKDSIVASPLSVAGSVPGSWSHEGQFTVQLLGADGALIAEAPADIQGDWMTDQPALFAASLSFEEIEGTTGSLVLIKANPSDLTENDDSVTIPVRFN